MTKITERSQVRTVTQRLREEWVLAKKAGDEKKARQIHVIAESLRRLCEKPA